MHHSEVPAFVTSPPEAFDLLAVAFARTAAAEPGSTSVSDELFAAVTSRGLEARYGEIGDIRARSAVLLKEKPAVISPELSNSLVRLEQLLAATHDLQELQLDFFLRCPGIEAVEMATSAYLDVSAYKFDNRPHHSTAEFLERAKNFPKLETGAYLTWQIFKGVIVPGKVEDLIQDFRERIYRACEAMPRSGDGVLPLMGLDKRILASMILTFNVKGVHQFLVDDEERYRGAFDDAAQAAYEFTAIPELLAPDERRTIREFFYIACAVAEIRKQRDVIPLIQQELEREIADLTATFGEQFGAEVKLEHKKQVAPKSSEIDRTIENGKRLSRIIYQTALESTGGKIFDLACRLSEISRVETVLSGPATEVPCDETYLWQALEENSSRSESLRRELSIFPLLDLEQHLRTQVESHMISLEDANRAMEYLTPAVRNHEESVALIQEYACQIGLPPSVAETLPGKITLADIDTRESDLKRRLEHLGHTDWIYNTLRLDPELIAIPAIDFGRYIDDLDKVVTGISRLEYHKEHTAVSELMTPETFTREGIERAKRRLYELNGNRHE